MKTSTDGARRTAADATRPAARRASPPRARTGRVPAASIVAMALALTAPLGRGVSRAGPQPKSAGAGGSAAAGGAATQTDEPMMTALLARFAKAPGVFARYREEKHLAMLQVPLVNEGTIHFSPPGRLARHTVKPIASTLLIDDNKVQFGSAQGAEGSESLDLGTNPVARAFVDSFIMLLAGNRAGLERYFTIKFARVRGPKVEPDAWHLALVPRTSPMDKIIKEITLDGRGLVIREMIVRETSGDWTSTVFSDVDTAHKYDAAEQARVFRLQK